MSQITDEAMDEILQRVSEAMAEGGSSESKRVRFDGTVNLGHILTILTMISAVFIVYLNNKIAETDHEFRIKSIENTQAEFKTSLRTISDTQAQTAMNQQKISLTLDMLTSRIKP